jgi:sugar lactone lactonase YvrE
MLHNSPNGMGIAWQHSLVYWVFDGFHSSLTLYDFFTDHGPAGTDHTDGIIKRYVEGEVLWVENVPSHMQFDPPGGHLLYVADTGHSRIAVLDTTTGVQGPPIFPNYDGCDQTRVDGAILTTFVDGLLLDPPMTMPSGLAIHGGHVFVSDHASSIVYAFDMQGQLIDWLYTELPPGSLMGLTFDADGRLHFADALGNQIVRISALPESAD